MYALVGYVLSVSSYLTEPAQGRSWQDSIWKMDSKLHFA